MPSRRGRPVRAIDSSDSFDYIVVGGGTAGCVVAARLSEDPHVSVLLLEAGGDERRPDVETPEAWSTLLGTDADWAYKTTVQRATGHAYPAPRGKVLGGSGSINCLTHLRGHRHDFDEWARLGADGWDYAGVLPYFKRSEDVPAGDPRYRGRGGPLHPRPGVPDAFAIAFADGARQAGHRAAGDFNAADMTGAGPTESLIRAGRRESTASAYLRPAMSRPNLTVRTNVVVCRLSVTAGRCDGVEYACGGATVRAAAAAEVVLCAGAIGSPCLLLRSGIGPASELTALGIRPLLDARQVGQNLQDHVLLAGIRYRAERREPWAEGADGTSVLLRTGSGQADPSQHGPDVHLFVMDGDYRLEWQQPLDDCFTFGIGHLRPRSRGSVRLASADPQAAPVIDPRYLSEDYDLHQLVAGIEAVDQIVRTGAFDAWGGASETSALLRLRDADLGAAVRAAVSSYFHLSGTCRMGSDAAAVVDPLLRVNGICGLRVADASVMPSVVTANTNAATVMIGEKAADLLRGRSLREGEVLTS